MSVLSAGVQHLNLSLRAAKGTHTRCLVLVTLHMLADSIHMHKQSSSWHLAMPSRHHSVTALLQQSVLSESQSSCCLVRSAFESFGNVCVLLPARPQRHVVAVQKVLQALLSLALQCAVHGRAMLD